MKESPRVWLKKKRSKPLSGTRRRTMQGAHALRGGGSTDYGLQGPGKSMIWKEVQISWGREIEISLREKDKGK